MNSPLFRSNRNDYHPGSQPERIEAQQLTSIQKLLDNTPLFERIVQINGSNLLDEKYFELDEYDNTHHGEPRAVSASVNVRF